MVVVYCYGEYVWEEVSFFTLMYFVDPQKRFVKNYDSKSSRT